MSASIPNEEVRRLIRMLTVTRGQQKSVRLSVARTRGLFERGCPAGEELADRVFRFHVSDNLTDIRIG
jgi:hypothetical protein